MAHLFVQVHNPLVRKFLLDKLAVHQSSSVVATNFDEFPIHQLAVYPPVNKLNGKVVSAAKSSDLKLFRPSKKSQEVVSSSEEEDEEENDHGDYDDEEESSINNERTNRNDHSQKQFKSLLSTSSGGRGPGRKRRKVHVDPYDYLAASESDTLSNIGTMKVSANQTNGDITFPIAAITNSSGLLPECPTSTEVSADLSKQLFDRYENDGYLFFKGLLLTEKEKKQVKKIADSIVYMDQDENTDFEESRNSDMPPRKKRKERKKFPPNLKVDEINKSCGIINSILPHISHCLELEFETKGKLTRPKGFTVCVETKTSTDSENRTGGWETLKKSTALNSLFSESKLVDALKLLGDGASHVFESTMKEGNHTHRETAYVHGSLLSPRVFHPTYTCIHFKASGEFAKEGADWFDMLESTGFYSMDMAEVEQRLSVLGKQVDKKEKSMELTTSEQKVGGDGGGGGSGSDGCDSDATDKVEGVLIKQKSNHSSIHSSDGDGCDSDATDKVESVLIKQNSNHSSIHSSDGDGCDSDGTDKVEGVLMNEQSLMQSGDGDSDGDSVYVAPTMEQENQHEEDADEEDEDICVVCGLGNNPSTMLLCDECNQGYHCGCLAEPLQSLPKDDWFCDDCASAPRPIVGKIWIPMEDHPLSGGVICLIPKSHKLPNIRRLGGVPSALLKKKPCKRAGVECWVTSSFQPGDVLIYNPKLVIASSKSALGRKKPVEVMELFKKSISTTFGICPLNRKTWGQTPSSLFMESLSRA